MRWETSMNGNDDIFDGLGDIQRRQVLVDLLTNDPRHVPQLSGMTREMATGHEALLRLYLDSSRSIAGVDDDQLSLHTVHLPNLTDDDFIEWDQEANSVTKGTRYSEMRPILRLLDDEGRESPVQEVEISQD